MRWRTAKKKVIVKEGENTPKTYAGITTENTDTIWTSD